MNKKILGILSISLFVGNQTIGSFCGAYANVASICVIIISGFIGFYSWKLFDDEREEVKKEHLGRNQELVECIQMWQNTTLQKIEKMIENSQKQMDDMNAFQGTVEAYGKESLDCYREMQEELKRLNDKLKDIVTTELNQEENNHKFYIDFRDTVTQSLEKTRDILEKSYTDITESINSLEEMVEDSKESVLDMANDFKKSVQKQERDLQGKLSDSMEELQEEIKNFSSQIQGFREAMNRICDQVTRELREIQELLPFFKLINESNICAEKRMKEILVLRKIVNYQLQIGNYRRAIRYFLAVKLLLNDLKPYKKKAAKRATEYMLRR